MVWLPVLLFSAAAAGRTLLPPDPSNTIGNTIRFDGFVDDNDREFAAPPQTTETRPWIVSPIYTRCPHTCSAITDGLRRALVESGLQPSEYRILSFSFDPLEMGDGLQRFRSIKHLPADWLLLRAVDQQALERTLASLDFRTITLGDGEIEHPNLVAVLAPDMRLSRYLFGVTVSPAELARSVRAAQRGVSTVDSWRPYLFVFALLGFLASALAFFVLLSRRRNRR